MKSGRTLLLALLSGLLLQTIAAQVNHYLSPLGLSVFLGGLVIVFPALRLPFSEGWKCVALLGLCADARSPVPFGLHAGLFLVAYFVIFNFRQRIPREENFVGIVLAILANLGLYVAFCALFVWRHPLPFQGFSRFFFELAASSILIALIAPWSFAFQEALLERAGVNLRQESRGFF